MPRNLKRENTGHKWVKMRQNAFKVKIHAYIATINVTHHTWLDGIARCPTHVLCASLAYVMLLVGVTNDTTPYGMNPIHTIWNAFKITCGTRAFMDPN